jgi:hypothetical protein
MPGFGEMKLQAPCREGAPARVAPWKWQWEPACPRFAPELREYPHMSPGAVVTDIRVVR